MWRLIVHSLARRRSRSLTTVLGVGLGVGLLFAVFVGYLGLTRGLDKGQQRLGADLLAVPFHAQVDVDQALFSGSPLNVYMDRGLAEAARKIPGVRRVEAQFYTHTLELPCCGNVPEIRLIGIEPEAVRRLAGMSSEGETRIADDEVIVGAGLIDSMGWKGSRIELLGEIFRISYSLDSTGIGLDRSILMPIDTARKLAGSSEALKPVWDEAGPPDRLISALLVEVEDPSHIGEVKAALEDLGNLRVVQPAKTFQRIKATIASFALVLGVAGLLPALAGMGYLWGNIISAAWDRKGEWALYRALGATRLQLAKLVVGEAVVTALAGVLLGLPLGFGLYQLAVSRLAAEADFPLVPPGAWVFAFTSLAAVLLYALIGLLAALPPAWRVARLEPARIMAQGDID